MRLEVDVYFIWCKLDGDCTADVNMVHHHKEGIQLDVSEVTGITHRNPTSVGDFVMYPWEPPAAYLSEVFPFNT